MPTHDEIQRRVLSQKAGAQDELRRRFLKELHEYTENDVIIYATAFSTLEKQVGLPSFLVSLTLDDVPAFMSALHGLKGDSLDLILHSSGGSMEAAEQIVDYLRSKYKKIRAIIPQNAMSVATMIACACDSIVMGKHSALGPIDPQVIVSTTTGRVSIPAQAILDEFSRAKKEVTESPGIAALWIKKIENYPPGILDVCEKTIDSARKKVEEWLGSYMLRECPDNQTKASEIAGWLADTKEHKTHGRPITINKALGKGLQIQSLEEDQRFQELVMSVFHATAVTFEVSNCVKLVENHNGKGRYVRIDREKQTP